MKVVGVCDDVICTNIGISTVMGPTNYTAIPSEFLVYLTVSMQSHPDIIASADRWSEKNSKPTTSGTCSQHSTHDLKSRKAVLYVISAVCSLSGIWNARHRASSQRRTCKRRITDPRSMPSISRETSHPVPRTALLSMLDCTRVFTSAAFNRASKTQMTTRPDRQWDPRSFQRPTLYHMHPMLTGTSTSSQFSSSGFIHEVD
ncbi:hypothetical protein B0O80DRAFT_110615 [Mortierella sp. GBAus27b]|nr:hypothetical protein B0O80DRAFT_110615 [Mortierella sp. GBAus27b]